MSHAPRPPTELARICQSPGRRCVPHTQTGQGQDPRIQVSKDPRTQLLCHFRLIFNKARKTILINKRNNFQCTLLQLQQRDTCAHIFDRNRRTQKDTHRQRQRRRQTERRQRGQRTHEVANLEKAILKLALQQRFTQLAAEVTCNSKNPAQVELFVAVKPTQPIPTKKKKYIKIKNKITIKNSPRSNKIKLYESKDKQTNFCLH